MNLMSQNTDMYFDSFNSSQIEFWKIEALEAFKISEKSKSLASKRVKVPNFHKLISRKNA